eukprot:3161055-Rhodomonas_salina.2
MVHCVSKIREGGLCVDAQLQRSVPMRGLLEVFRFPADIELHLLRLRVVPWQEDEAARFLAALDQ